MSPRSDAIDPFFVMYCKMYGQMLLRPILFVIMVHVLIEPCGYWDVINIEVIRLFFSCLFVF